MLNSTSIYLLIQKVKNTPTSKVRSAAVGLVEFYGSVVCDEELYSPLSKVKCVYYALVVEYYRSGKRSGWIPIFFDVQFRKFYLQDETGKILVNPITEAGISVPVKNVYQGYISGVDMFGRPHKQIDQKVLDFMEANPRVKELMMKYKDSEIRVSETYIAEGDKLYVLGSAEPIPGKASDVAHENLVVKRGADGIFYISDTHETNVLNNLQNSFFSNFIWGILFSVIGLIMIFLSVGIF